MIGPARPPIRASLADSDPPHCVQQIVVGAVGVNVPVAVPPLGAHAPPDGVDADAIALSVEVALSTQLPGGAGREPVVHIALLCAVTLTLVHAAPATPSHVHALQSRVSVAEPYAICACGYAGGHASSFWRATQYVSTAKGRIVFGVQTLPGPQTPGVGEVFRQRRTADDHPAAGTVFVGWAGQLPPAG